MAKVRYVVLVTVVNGRHDLLEELAGLTLLETSVRNDKVQHLASARVFHHQEEHLATQQAISHIVIQPLRKRAQTFSVSMTS